MPKKPNPARIKRHQVYTPWEAAEALGLHRQTVIRWIKSGSLEADQSRRPWLIEGKYLKAFLEARRSNGKCKLKVGEDVRIPYSVHGVRHGMSVKARPAKDASFEKAKLMTVVDKLEAGAVVRYATVRFMPVSRIVRATQIKSRHTKGAHVLVKLKSWGVVEKRPLEARVSALCADGAYAVMYENDQVASITQYLFWRRTKKFSWFELDHCIIAVISSYRKMLRIDMQLDDEARRDEEDIWDDANEDTRDGALAYTRRLVKTV